MLTSSPSFLQDYFNIIQNLSETAVGIHANFYGSLRSPGFFLCVFLCFQLLMFSSQWLMTKLASFHSFHNDGSNKSRLSLVLQFRSLTDCLETCWEVLGLRWQHKAPDENSSPSCLHSQFHMNLVLRANETPLSSARLTALLSLLFRFQWISDKQRIFLSLFLCPPVWSTMMNKFQARPFIPIASNAPISMTQQYHLKLSSLSRLLNNYFVELKFI